MLNRRGFTLIELLVVTTIIGVLAGIAIPKYSSMKERAHLSTMKSDLRNLVTAQENYFIDALTYGDESDLTGQFNASSGVTIDVTAAGVGGWAAKATHTATTLQCTVAVGIEAAPTDLEGSPVCS